MNQNNTKIKYFLYARKSSESEDRQMASIDSQIDELTKYAKEQGLNIVETFTESQSAKSPGRPVFNKMLEQLNAGKANGVLCWKLNRLARNSVDGGSIIWMLQEGILQHVQTYGRSYFPTDNAVMMYVEFGVANQFIRDLRVDTKRGLKSKAERGWYPSSWLTFGYIHNPKKKKGDEEIIIDEPNFSLLRKMFDLILSGKNTPMEAFTITTNEWGLRNKNGGKIAKGTFYRILSDRFLCGEYEYPKKSGIWYQGKHTPMITKSEYEIIQKLLKRNNKPMDKTLKFTFRGPIFCGECGAMVTAENKIKIQKNGNRHEYIFYHCTKRKNPNCTQKSIQEKELEKEILKELENIEIPQEFYEWAMRVIKEENKKESNERDHTRENIQIQWNKCVKKLDQLIDMRASGEINEEEFVPRKKVVLEEKERFEKLLNESSTRVNEWIENVDQMFHFATYARERFQNGSPETKKEILRLLGSNLLLKDKKVTIYAQKPLVMLKEISQEVKEIYERFELQKTLMNKRTLDDLYTQSPTLLPG